jgi:TolA-binding protein
MVRAAVHLWFLLGVLALVAMPTYGQESGTAGRSSESSRPKGGGEIRRLPEGLNFANGLFRQRKFELAAEEYERFLATNPSIDDRNDARFGLATARLFQQRYQDAQVAFRMFLADAPNHPRARSAWYRLGEVSYLLGDLAESRQALETFTAGDGSHPNLETAWTYLGDVCLALKDLPAARRAYETGLSAFPKGTLVDRARYGLGRSLAGLNHPDDALKVLGELARTGKREWVDRARLQIGSIHLAADRLDQAIDAFETLDRESPNSLLRPEADLRRADALIRLKKPEEAIPLLKAIAEDPTQSLGPQASLTLATIELERDRSQAAIDGLEAAIKRFPNSPLMPSLVFRLAESLVRLDRPGDARAKFVQVAEQWPSDPWAEPALIRALKLAIAAGDFDAVRNLAAAFEKRFPRSSSIPEIRLIAAKALRGNKRPHEAIPILERLLGEAAPGAEPKPGVEPKIPADLARQARYELALAYRDTGLREKSDATLSSLTKLPESKSENTAQALSNDSVTADAQFLVGQADVEAGRFKEAIGLLESYLKSRPNGEVADAAMAHLATARIGLGEFEAATSTLDRLAKEHPTSPNLNPTRLRLAEAELAASRYDNAVNEFRRLSADFESTHRVRVQSGLGQALWHLKRPSEAAVAFGVALDAAPDAPAAPDLAMAKARALDAAGQVGPALEAYANVANRYEPSPQAVPAIVARARLLTRADKPDEASAAYESLFKDQARVDRAVATGSTIDALLSEWGWSLVDAGKTWEADRVFGRILKEFPDGDYADDARFNLAESANSAHDHAEVIRLLKPLAVSGAKVSPELLPDVLYRLGRSEIESKDWSAAAPILDRLIAEFPNSPRRPEARLFRAEVGLQLGEAAGALANLSALLTELDTLKDARSSEFKTLIRRRIVQCLVSLGRWEEALAQAESLESELAKDDPVRAELDFARGRALQGLAKMGEARDAYQAVIEARKGGDLAAQARFMRGETFFHEEKLGEARREFLMVDTLHDAPKWQAAALFEVGKVYERLGQWTEATHYFRMLISKFPSDTHVSDAKGHLEAALERSKGTGADGRGVSGERREDLSARVGQE